MINPDLLASEYLALWNDPDATSRDQRLANAWTQGARYADPIMASEGWGGISAMIAGVRAQLPGHTFTLRGEPDGHGSFARFSWTLSGEDGRLIATGTDIIRTTQDGQIEEVIGFLDKEFV